MSIEIREAHRADILRFFGERNPEHLAMMPTMKAWLGEKDGEILGIGGLALKGWRWIAFCDLTDEARRYKVSIVKLGKRIMQWADERNIVFVYLTVDPEEPGAQAWATSLGFAPDPRSTTLWRRMKGVN